MSTCVATEIVWPANALISIVVVKVWLGLARVNLLLNCPGMPVVGGISVLTFICTEPIKNESVVVIVTVRVLPLRTYCTVPIGVLLAPNPRTVFTVWSALLIVLYWAFPLSYAVPTAQAEPADL